MWELGGAVIIKLPVVFVTLWVVGTEQSYTYTKYVR
jgi:hypothetical protein